MSHWGDYFKPLKLAPEDWRLLERWMERRISDEQLCEQALSFSQIRLMVMRIESWNDDDAADLVGAQPPPKPLRDGGVA